MCMVLMVLGVVLVVLEVVLQLLLLHFLLLQLLLLQLCVLLKLPSPRSEKVDPVRYQVPAFC